MMTDGDKSSPVHKASILRQMFVGGKVSKDRLRRVQGLSHSPTPGSATSADELMSFIVGDPFVAVFDNMTKDGHRTRCLAILISRSVDDSASTATGPVLLLDASDGYLLWNKETSTKTVKVKKLRPNRHGI